MSELFDIPPTKSPRLKWMDEHGVWVFKYHDRFEATARGFTEKGQTEHDAVVNLAIKMNIKLWNE